MAGRRKTVRLNVTTELLERLLRLDESMHIEGARLNDGVLTFTVRAPNAPAGAFEMVPHYFHNGRPDPVTLTEVEWRLPEGRAAITPVQPPEHAATTSRGRQYETDPEQPRTSELDGSGGTQ